MAGELAYDPETDKLVYSPATGQLALNCSGAIYALTPCGTTCCQRCDCCYSHDSWVRFRTTTVTNGPDHGVYIDGWTAEDEAAFDALFTAGVDVMVPFSACRSVPAFAEWVVTSGGFTYTVRAGSCSGTSIVWALTIDRVATGDDVGWSNTGGTDPVGTCSDGSATGSPGSVADGGGWAYNITWQVELVYNNCQSDGASGCEAASTRCPGTGAIYTSTDLSAYIGKTIEISEDPDVCYLVSVAGSSSDGDVTPIIYYDSCGACCDDADGTAIT